MNGTRTRILNQFGVLFFGLLFYGLGGPSNGNPDASSDNNIFVFIDSLYFSGVTFTTLGFGDLHPEPSNVIMKIVAFLEALGGATFIALFVVSLSRKIMR